MASSSLMPSATVCSGAGFAGSSSNTGMPLIGMATSSDWYFASSTFSLFASVPKIGFLIGDSILRLSRAEAAWCAVSVWSL